MIDKTVCINIGGFVAHDGLTMGKSVNGYNGQYWGEKSENGHNGRMTLSQKEIRSGHCETKVQIEGKDNI